MPSTRRAHSLSVQAGVTSLGTGGIAPWRYWLCRRPAAGLLPRPATFAVFCPPGTPTSPSPPGSCVSWLPMTRAASSGERDGVMCWR